MAGPGAVGGAGGPSLGRTIPALGVREAELIADSERSDTPPKPIQEAVANLGDVVCGQADILLQLYTAAGSGTIGDLAEQGKTDPNKKTIVDALITPEFKGSKAYATSRQGKVSYDPKKGKVKADKNRTQEMAEEVTGTKQAKAEWKILKKDPKEGLTHTAEYQKALGYGELGKLVTKNFNLSKGDLKGKQKAANTHLRAAVDYLYEVKPEKKGGKIGDDPRAIIKTQVAYVQALATKSSADLGKSSAKLTELKQRVDGNKAGSTDELAKKLIDKAEQDVKTMTESPQQAAGAQQAAPKK
jgi:hypothetical protein